MKTFLPGQVLALLLCSIACLPCQAATPDQPPPTAEAVLHKLSDHLGGLKTLKTELRAVMDMRVQGMQHELRADYSIARQRPNRFAMRLAEGTAGASLVCDGTQVFTSIPFLKKYTLTDAPADLEALTTQRSMEMISSGTGGAPLLDALLLAKDPYARLTRGALTNEYLGLEEIDEVECARLKCAFNDYDWELWVQTGEQPMLRRAKVDLAKLLGRMRQPGAETPGDASKARDLKMVLTLNFTNWQDNPLLADDAFKFAPPKEAEKASTFFETTAASGPHKLTGKPAPGFTLALLDGGEMKLAAHKGKQVVILDFWATWCGPCARALPVLAEVGAAYKEKGVVLYAVNQDEEADMVREFLKKRALKLTVALDKDSSVGQLYGAESIPQTVIIDTNGVVQAVHVGLLPELKKQLSGELDKLIAGKSLVGPPAKD